MIKLESLYDMSFRVSSFSMAESNLLCDRTGKLFLVRDFEAAYRVVERKTKASRMGLWQVLFSNLGCVFVKLLGSLLVGLSSLEFREVAIVISTHFQVEDQVLFLAVCFYFSRNLSGRL